MSGPVALGDVEPVPGDGSRPTGGIEVMESRLAQIGPLRVQRALPQRTRRTVGAWCFLDHGPVDPSDVAIDIGPHPHIGLQTVTWMLEGELLHRDSLGSEQPIRPGELNLMTAGHGIVHAEERTGNGRVEIVQLWVAQPAATRDGAPAFEHHAALPQLALGGGTATVFVGTLGGARSPARRDTEHVGLDVAVHARSTLPADPRFEYAVVPIRGVVHVDDRPIAPGALAYIAPGLDELALRAEGPARAIVLGGVPFDEPILMWWNYVARTRDEISAAHREWTERGDRFPLPASRLAPIDIGPPPWQ